MLPRKQRIRKNSFRDLLGGGRSATSGPLTVRVYGGLKSETAQVAVIVSKKIAKTAVLRNKMRRRVYSALRPLISTLKSNRYLVYSKKEILDISFDELKKVCKEVLSKSN
jgi:ribonuclease P protein component